MNRVKVLMATSEAVPFAKTGGLADVAGALSLALETQCADVKVIMPKYKAVDTDRFSLVKTNRRITIPVGMSSEKGTVWKTAIGNNIEVLFIEHEYFFGREGLYGTQAGDYTDNLERFVFFCKAVLKYIKAVKWKPDIIHCHDWQTALIPVYLKILHKKDKFYRSIKTIFTIHNLAFQGIFPWERYLETGLGWDQFTYDKLEFFQQLNLLKGGLVYSDKLTTVSPTYAEEILTPEAGSGLDSVLLHRKNDFTGILNGLDYSVWSPGTDSALPERYSSSQPENKLALKKHLLKKTNLTVRSLKKTPVLGSVSRLTDQKGYDIIAEALPKLMKRNLRLVILGTGEEKYHTLLTGLAEKYPKKLSVNLFYDDAMAHLIYAGTDMFLMPSKFEPCGLGQLIALKYGSIPIVNHTGGLADTIHDFNSKTGDGNGFVMRDYSAESLLEAVGRGLELYKKAAVWKEQMLKGMNQDFSWKNSAKKYLKLYKSLL